MEQTNYKKVVVIDNKISKRNKNWWESNNIIEEAAAYRARHQGIDCGDVNEDCLITKKELQKQITI